MVYAVQSNPEQPLPWRDPPHYWERIVYSAYLEAHSDLFEGGNVEGGKPTSQTVKNLVLIEGLEMEMIDVVEKCCNILMKNARHSDINLGAYRINRGYLQLCSLPAW